MSILINILNNYFICNYSIGHYHILHWKLFSRHTTTVYINKNVVDVIYKNGKNICILYQRFKMPFILFFGQIKKKWTVLNYFLISFFAYGIYIFIAHYKIAKVEMRSKLYHTFFQYIFIIAFRFYLAIVSIFSTFISTDKCSTQFKNQDFICYYLLCFFFQITIILPKIKRYYDVNFRTEMIQICDS